MLRFDMDALPITEETGAEYASEIPGVMHACGHDAHTAVGLTVARMLHNYRDQLAGTIKFVFQPAEEGLGGAERMVKEGVLQNPTPAVALGLHVWNEKPLGWVGIGSGPVMAAGEVFDIRIIGKGGHGALPQLAVDPVAAAAQVISSLQTIVSRNVAPLDTAVVSACSIHGGDAFNVIPPHVDIKGTIRTFKPETREMVIRRFYEIIDSVSAAMGCKAEREVRLMTPAVINDKAIAEKVLKAARELLPAATIDTEDKTMGSEDMAYFLREVPGCFFFVGSANQETGKNAPHHHPKFDIDEDVLPKAAALMASAAVECLNL
jgi:amidohydrolase